MSRMGKSVRRSMTQISQRRYHRRRGFRRRWSLRRLVLVSGLNDATNPNSYTCRWRNALPCDASCAVLPQQRSLALADARPWPRRSRRNCGHSGPFCENRYANFSEGSLHLKRAPFWPFRAIHLDQAAQAGRDFRQLRGDFPDQRRNARLKLLGSLYPSIDAMVETLRFDCLRKRTASS